MAHGEMFFFFFFFFFNGQDGLYFQKHLSPFKFVLPFDTGVVIWFYVATKISAQFSFKLKKKKTSFTQVP